MLYALNFFLGFVLIEVRGSYPERFLNLLAKNKISFWNMQRIDIGVLRLCMPISDYFKIHDIARRSMCHVHILKKIGFPFFARRFKKRLALIIGLFIFSFAAWILTSFIWVIDISGCKTVDPDLIYKHLSYNGVKIGAYANNIDYAALKNDILLNIPDLINITVNINGSHANVTVRERTHAPEILDYDTPSNIIADCDGIITSIAVTSGTPEVKIGDTVMRGDLLASGYMTGRSGTTLQMRAIADIRARTWQNLRITMPENVEEKIYTGNTKKLYTLILGKKRINLYFGTGNLYTKCDKIIKSSRLTLPGQLKLPIVLETCFLQEYETSTTAVPQETLFEYMSSRAEQYIELEDSDILLNCESAHEIKDGAASLLLTVECEKDIGIEQMIPKGE